MNNEIRKCGGYHALFALFSVFIGILYYKLIETRPTVFTVVFFIYAGVFFVLCRKKLSRESVLFMAATIIYSLRFLIYDNDVISGLTIIIIHITALLFVASATRNITDDIIVNSVKAVFQAPFASFFALPVCIVKFICAKRQPKTDDEKARRTDNIAYIIVGLCISLPVVLIVSGLLGSDGFFDNFINDVLVFMNNFRLSFRVSVHFNIITVLVSLFLFGALYSSDTEKYSEVKIYKKCCIPFAMMATLMVLLSLIYAVFVISQLDGYICMIMRRLPEGLTFADFARSGFFELCAVACINGVVLYVANGFSGRDAGAKALKVFSYIIVVFTLFLIFTAASKMIYYISAFGFTPKRFYTLWFMLLLTVIFVFGILWLKNKEFKISKYSVYITLFMLLILLFVDFKGISYSLNLWLGY